MLTKSLSLPSYLANTDSAHLVNLLTQVLNSHTMLCWLHNAGEDIIGLYPKWYLQAKKTSTHTKNNSSGINMPNALLQSNARHISSVESTTDILTQLHYQKTKTTQLKQDELQDNINKEINHYLSQQAEMLWESTKAEQTQNFYQGLMGFFSYDLSAAYTAPHNGSLIEDAAAHCPLMFLGHYDIYLKKHHHNNTSNWQLHFEPEAIAIALAIKQHIESSLMATDLPLETTHDCYLYHLNTYWDKTEYSNAFHHIQDYLKAGDCYQVNLAQNITANYTGNPASLISMLHAATRAPYAGFMQIDDYAILSCSPELFLSFDAEGNVITKPIKGTLPRLPEPSADKKQIETLSASKKNQAENLMIVDLLRNDLSVYAKTGSVTVPKLFEIESFAQVHHMVSTITAQLKADKNATDLLINALPGGSITGAPKVRAIEIIHELETQPRGAYCGSMGYLNFDGSGEWNILIRTLQFWQGKMSLWAGGGITIASDCDEEYQECMDKISGILSVLQSKVVDIPNDTDEDFNDESVG